MKQQTLAMAAHHETGFEQHRRPTRRDEFLDTMNRIVPRAELCAVIESHSPKRGKGRPPIGLERLARIHFPAGVDSQSGLAHSAAVAPANVRDKHPLPDLLHGQEQRVYGDSAHAGQKDLMHSKAPHARDFTNCRTRKPGGEVDEVKRGKNRNKSKIRSRVEHAFAVVNRLWGFTKVRYRGLAKNADRALAALALANIYLSRNRLMAQVRP